MKRLIYLSIFFTMLLLSLHACTLAGSPQIPEASTPNQSSDGSDTLTVMAAASLTESFNELGNIFEAQNPGVRVSFSFAGSQQLAQQLSQGADADVFASASKTSMDAAVDAQRVSQDQTKIFANNRMVVIFPKESSSGLKALKDLAMPGLKLVIADKSVPAGQYSLDFLDKASDDPGFDAAFKENVLKNVVSYEDNVKSVFTKVELGEADAGIVYVTDIGRDSAGSVGVIEIPENLNTIASYPIAPILDSRNADLANAFVDLVLSADGQSILSGYGFLPASVPASVPALAPEPTPEPAAEQQGI